MSTDIIDMLLQLFFINSLEAFLLISFIMIMYGKSPITFNGATTSVIIGCMSMVILTDHVHMFFINRAVYLLMVSSMIHVMYFECNDLNIIKTFRYAFRGLVLLFIVESLVVFPMVTFVGITKEMIRASSMSIILYSIPSRIFEALAIWGAYKLKNRKKEVLK